MSLLCVAETYIKNKKVPGADGAEWIEYELYVLPGHPDWPADEGAVQLHRQLRSDDHRRHHHHEAAAFPAGDPRWFFGEKTRRL